MGEGRNLGWRTKNDVKAWLRNHATERNLAMSEPQPASEGMNLLRPPVAASPQRCAEMLEPRPMLPRNA